MQAWELGSVIYIPFRWLVAPDTDAGRLKRCKPASNKDND